MNPQHVNEEVEMSKKMSKTLIRRIREATGLSQVAFAKRLGCTVVQVSRWENGHAVPSPVFTEKLRSMGQRRGVSV
jgi:DNA-binding transcriptional regulator YiaG